MTVDPFGARGKLVTAFGPLTVWRLAALESRGLIHLDRLPYSLRILLESVLRQVDGQTITEGDVAALAGWQPHAEKRPEIPFRPARVLLQDFTGLPALVDLAAMRSALARLGGDPQRINPLLPVDLVIDHSVQVDFFASPEALRRNAELEFQRNRERYEFLRWGQARFEHLRVVPPATGIVHQVNLEFLAEVVLRGLSAGEATAYPDSLVGTDSHTTMINGLGVLGWGVGGIEAEAVMLGQPLVLVAPEVVGVRLVGEMSEGVTATDLVLTITQLLRRHGVVEKFVEFTGPGLTALSLPDRATLANMAPEYGATVGFFPVDDETLRYLRLTGRPPEVLDRVERYCKEQGLFHGPETPEPEFSQRLEVDLSRIESSIAGPKRPQDRVPLAEVRTSFRQSLTTPPDQRGFRPDRRSHSPHGPHRHEWGRLRDRPRRGGDRRHHLLHQHLQPRPDDDRRPAGAPCRGTRIDRPAARQDQPGTRLARRHRVFDRCRVDGAAGSPRFQCRGLRLHDVHRQQRTARR